ncbi:dihydrolipoamide acetyltransferase family protein [Actinoplanes teichomyceticus]|uniref:Dihydrolipoamide acetyltransferase component of pyruvate dehydrogenase complex n=1 Tax=Actinoplanes teichomyceticus TaxID=1867 RepID=A0A561WK49_ACTTI|nr:dihydrolipoamide acetyltransferase family protein [Actinoplanes teichomyceticus]TWG24245.1 pyruvate dehydrogenase E2 component (dihydrolipoamide acetyltransferase) [Actinoplanes teichomyceticus]GIF12909.1 dihydrolipoamide acetyltransferase component of pyruvate dehydrogenase complex [Actinoplanes teichomyceticus]
MTERIFRLPDLGEGLTEAEVVQWLVAEGDVVAVDQGIAEVETAKSLVEVPSPYAGRVTTRHVPAGSTLAVGDPLITVAESAADRYREEEQAGSGNVLIGYGTSGAPVTARRRRPRAGVRTAAGAQPVPAGAQPVPAGAQPVPAAGARPAPAAGAPRVISPLVRHLARDSGVDLNRVEPTGPGGVIMRADVERAIAASAATAAAAVPGPAATPVPAATPFRAATPGPADVPVPAATPAPAGAPGPGDAPGSVAGERRVPLTGFRKAAAAALTRSRAEIPEATVWVDVDATRLWQLRESNPGGPGLLAYLARFVVAGLRGYPVLNARFDADRQEIVQFDRVDLGIAVQGERGLVVPAVIGADTMNTTRLGEEIRRLTAVARAGRATARELSAGTFTLNNYGGFGVDGSAAVINHPQVAILGFGRIIDRPWVVDGALCVRKITQMSFVFDHRVCDGGTAAGFMRAVADAIEDPASAIARL